MKPQYPLIPLSLFFSAALWVTVFLWSNPNTVAHLMEWEVTNLGGNTLTIPLILDNQGVLMAATVSFIAANVMLFSKTYMQSEPKETRFNLIVLSFVIAMLLLVFIPNILVILIGWDGLGITSFLLVIFYSNPKSLSAGMITALTNRIGDALIILSIGWMAMSTHWSIISLWHSDLDLIIMISIMLAACTKSAQVPFSSWLPAAMAAPTPVSALVHSSTLVTAGVFLLIRFYPFLSTIPAFNFMLSCMAALTMIMAGMAATYEPDMKKIIALSTLSQLGVMMGSIGMGLPWVAMFHLMTHALFKALLFVCAGTMIHFNSHSQDLRTTGNMMNLNLTASCFSIANLALCGAPFLAAFYSKDLILEYTLFSAFNAAIMFIFFAATAFTSVYTARAMTTMLWSPTSYSPLNSMSEDTMVTPIPMLNLTIGAIAGGAALNWLMIQPESIFILPFSLKMMPIMAAGLGAIMASVLSCKTNSMSISQPFMVAFNTSMWFLVPLSSQPFINYPMKSAFMFTHLIDQGWQEIMGGQGANNLFSKGSQAIIPLQNNPISTQLMMSLILLIPLSMF